MDLLKQVENLIKENETLKQEKAQLNCIIDSIQKSIRADFEYMLENIDRIITQDFQTIPKAQRKQQRKQTKCN